MGSIEAGKVASIKGDDDDVRSRNRQFDAEIWAASPLNVVLRRGEEDDASEMFALTGWLADNEAAVGDVGSVMLFNMGEEKKRRRETRPCEK